MTCPREGARSKMLSASLRADSRSRSLALIFFSISPRFFSPSAMSRESSITISSGGPPSCRTTALTTRWNWRRATSTTVFPVGLGGERRDWSFRFSPLRGTECGYASAFALAKSAPSRILAAMFRRAFTECAARPPSNPIAARRPNLGCAARALMNATTGAANRRKPPLFSRWTLSCHSGSD